MVLFCFLLMLVQRSELAPFGNPAVLGSFVAGIVAEEARTRGFAAPAFAGCAFIEACWDYCTSSGQPTAARGDSWLSPLTPTLNPRDRGCLGMRC